MKFTAVSLALLPLLDLAAGRPGHLPGRHKSKFAAKRQIDAPAPVTVYANAAGIPVSTVGAGIAAAATAASPSVDVTATAEVAVSQQTAGSPGGGWPTSDANGTASTLNGVTYSPYLSTGGCKSQADVTADFNEFAGQYGIVRLYGVDCDQVSMVSNAIKNSKNKLFLGIFDLDDIAGQVATMSKGLGGDWSRVDTVSVGNELVNNGLATVAQVTAALTTAKTALTAAGYNGPVVIVDTFIAVINNPGICKASDYCAINMHPFFDPNTSADQAGTFMTTQLARVRSVLAANGDSSKRVVVTETGWPWQGNANGLAVPGMTEQETALKSIKSVFASNNAGVFLFTAFNDLWKKPASATFNAEQYWGLAGKYSSSDSSSNSH